MSVAPHASGGWCLQVEGLLKQYGAIRAVDGLDLCAPLGAVTAVLGPNGAGKTTTIEICEGLRRADAGSVRVLGLDPAHDGALLRPRIGVMLQDGGLPTGARALELLERVARFYSRPLDTDALAARLGITAYARTAVRRLSGGQRQRLALALALVGRPELAFLDEPSAGLDPQARLAVWDLIRQARAAGVSVVLTTHDMDEAEALADVVAIIDHGRVVASGTPADLTGAGGAPASFDGPPGLDLADLRPALGAAVLIEEGPAGRYRLAGLVDAAALATVMAWCAARDVMPLGLTVGRRSLEDVYLELTGRSLT